MPKIEANDCEFYYERKGDGGDSILFLNGIMMSTESWYPLLEPFQDDYDVVLHDFRGQLMSEKPDGPYTMELHADDVNALMEKLDIESAHIVGTSYGSEVGMILAYKYPKRVKSLTVAAGVSELDERIKGIARIWKIGAEVGYRYGWKEEFYDTMEPVIFSPDFMEKNRTMLDERREQVNEFPEDFFKGFETLTDAFLELDITDQLENIKSPTLIISGEDDILKRPKFGKLIAEKVPNSEFILMEDVSHALVLEDPQEFTKLVREFISRTKE